VASFGKWRRRSPPLQLFDLCPQLLNQSLLIEDDLDQFVRTERVEALHITECTTSLSISMPFKLRACPVLANTIQTLPLFKCSWKALINYVTVEECTDPDDNIFLECAQAGEADYLVTGNKRHFPDRWKKTKVIGARELIELMIEQKK